MPSDARWPGPVAAARHGSERRPREARPALARHGEAARPQQPVDPRAAVARTSRGVSSSRSAVAEPPSRSARSRSQHLDGLGGAAARPAQPHSTVRSLSSAWKVDAVVDAVHGPAVRASGSTWPPLRSALLTTASSTPSAQAGVVGVREHDGLPSRPRASRTARQPRGTRSGDDVDEPLRRPVVVVRRRPTAAPCPAPNGPVAQHRRRHDAPAGRLRTPRRPRPRGRPSVPSGKSHSGRSPRDRLVDAA